MTAWYGKTVLVTGATGYLGRAVVAELLSNGATVRAAARRPDRLPNALLEGTTQYKADLAHPQSFAHALEGSDIVIHTAVSYGSYHSQQSTNVEGTGALARMAVEHSIARFVHISSQAAYGYRHTKIITEDTLPAATRDAYSLTKRHGEDAVRAVKGLDWVILRPGAIYGVDAPLWTRQMFKVATRRPFVFVGTGKGLSPLVHVDDVVEAILRSALHPSASQQAFNLVHPVPVTWRSFLSAYAALSGRHLRWFGVPVLPIRGISHILSVLSRTPSALASLPETLWFLENAPGVSMEKIADLLNWQPQVNLDEGMRRTRPYLQQMGLLP